MLIASLAQLPAACFFIGLTVGVIGVAPRLAWLPWVILAWSGVVTILGPSMNLGPEIMNLSVFHHVPHLPGVDVHALPPTLLAGTGLILGVVGVVGFARRDLA
ncbi:hypothetical protein VZC37_15500 [Gordonia sp. LSe1-13]|uniref:ABC transporter permease n=1 Tax=Gordonia sesuvii TaxID=3116777 RepID=A0ABU7MF69_9ACTN|nr:hypothetical protein [Gordonia sp. LSe1-13]